MEKDFWYIHEFKSNWPLGNAMQCPSQGMQMAALLSVVILIACQEGINSAFGFDLGSLHTLNVFFFVFHITALIILLWCSSLEDKLRWMFSLYDINKDGVLSPTEIRSVWNGSKEISQKCNFYNVFFKFDMKICIDIDNVFTWIRFSSR